MKKNILWVLVLLPLLGLSCVSQPIPWTPATVAPPTPDKAGVAPVAALAQRAELIKGPETVEPGKTVSLSRDGALLTALMNNRTIDAGRLGPQIKETYVPEARAAFDPVVLATASTGRGASRTKTSGSSSSSSSGSSSSSSSTTAASAATELLTQLQGLLAAVNQRDYQVAKTESSDGSVTLQNYFPTGTTLFLKGAVSATHGNLSGNGHEGSWTLGVDQSLLKNAGIGVNLVSLQQAKNTKAKSEYVFKQTVLETISDVETAYWELVLAKELLKIRQFAVKLSEEQLKRNEDLLAVGRAIEGDVMTTRAEKASYMADLVDAEASIRKKNLGLIHLLNPDNAQKWALEFEPADPAEVVAADLNIEASEKLALQYRPELAQARLDVANLGLDVVSARNNLLPTLDLSASYGRTSNGDRIGDTSKFLDDGDFNNYQVSLSFKAPLLNRAERARYRRAKLAGTQGERTLGSLELSVEADMRQAGVEVQRQWERIKANQEAVLSRTEELRIAQGRYEVGRTTNLDLLLVQRDFIQSQIDEASSRVAYIEALTAFYAAEGTLLERRGIFLDSETK